MAADRRRQNRAEHRWAGNWAGNEWRATPPALPWARATRIRWLAAMAALLAGLPAVVCLRGRCPCSGIGYFVPRCRACCRGWRFRRGLLLGRAAPLGGPRRVVGRVPGSWLGCFLAIFAACPGEVVEYRAFPVSFSVDRAGLQLTKPRLTEALATGRKGTEAKPKPGGPQHCTEGGLVSWLVGWV